MKDLIRLEEVVSIETTEALGAQGIFIDSPVTIDLVFYLYGLVISPREEISLVRLGHCFEELSETTIERIEENASYECAWAGASPFAVDKVGEPRCAAHVGRLTGLATEPPTIRLQSDMGRMVVTAAHEWTHNYLGQYSLGSEENLLDSDMLTINEGVALIVEDEVSSYIFRKYGGEPFLKSDSERWRRLRTDVDRLLAEGRIREAETYMEDARLEICGAGEVCPRKINQAYLAIKAVYGFGFEGENPTSRMVWELRAHYPTLEEFLEGIRDVGSYEEFLILCENHGISPDG